MARHGRGAPLGAGDEYSIENDEFYNTNDEYSIKNDELFIANDEFCIKNDELLYQK